MKSKFPGRVVLIPALLMVTLVVNGFGSSSIDSIAEEVSRPEGWTEETHGKSSDPNYAIVFPQDRVNRIDIIIEPSDWQIMLDDMTELYGEFGTAENTRGGFAGNMMPPSPERPTTSWSDTCLFLTPRHRGCPPLE